MLLLRGAELSDDRNLAAELVELERAQLGNELHDGVIPLLFVASSKVTNLRDKLASSGQQAQSPEAPTDLRPALEQLAQWLDEAMQASRRLLTEIYPPDLEQRAWQSSVVEALDRLFPQWSDRIHWDLDAAVNEISPSIAAAIYRIVMEAIRNACQHGEATEVVVSGRRLGRNVEVAISDNGTGFDVSQVPNNHFGVRAMRCRAELIAGQLRIESKVGGPTEVVLTVPVEA